MKRAIFAVLLCFPACSLPNPVPEIGERFEIPAGSNQLLISSGQFWPHKEILIGGITYKIAANDRRRVAYVSTQDPNFRTPEGLGVGSTLAEVLKAGAKQPWAEPGWAYHTMLPSGWSVAFVAGRGLTDAPLQPNSKVSWVFKR